MKSRDEIIQEIYNSDWIKKMLVTFGGCNAKDLGQDYFEILCKKTDEEINQIYPYIKWWTITTLRNMSNPSNQSKAFVKNYISNHLNVYDIDIPATETEQIDAALIQARNKVLDRIYWFDRKLFEIYESGVKYSAIYRKTGIHHTTIKKSITTTIQLIKKEYERINGHC